MKKNCHFFIIAFAGFFIINEARSQWTQADGPFGGNVVSLAVDPADTTEIFAALTKDNGSTNSLCFSADIGSSWSQLATGLSLTYPPVLAMSQSKLYMGVSYPGLYMSTNQGTSWSFVLSASPFNSLFVRGLRVWVGSFGAFYYSPNVGPDFISSHWARVDTPFANLNVNCFTPLDSSLFVGTDKGIFLMTGDSSAWRLIDTGLTSINVRCLYTIDSTVFAGTSTNGIFRCTDKQNHWSQVLSDTGGLAISAFLTSGGYLYAGTSNGIYRSTDRGVNWELSSGGVASLGISSLASAGTAIIAGTSYGGVFISKDNSETWIQAKGSMFRPTIFSLATLGSSVYVGTSDDGVFCSPDTGNIWAGRGLTGDNVTSLVSNGSKLFSGTNTAGVCVSSDSGAHWTSANIAYTYPSVACLATHDSTVFVGSYYDGVFRSKDEGTTWAHTSVGLTNPYIFTLAVNNAGVFAGSGGTIYLSTNNGGSWVPVNNGPQNIYRLATCNANVLAGTYDGKISISSDNGASWQTAVSVPDDGIECYATVDSLVFAGTALGKVYLSTDSGNHWKIIGSSFTKGNIYSLTICDFNIFAGTSIDGLWRCPFSAFLGRAPAVPRLLSPGDATFEIPDSTTLRWSHVSGSSYYNFNIAFDSLFMKTLVNAQSKDTSIALKLGGDTTYYWRVNAVNSAGLSVWSPTWSFTTATPTLVREPSIIPGKSMLYQNFPNPFNPATTIKFDLRNEATVKLNVFNILGQRLRVVELGKLQAGSFEQRLDMSRYSSGVYIYRIEAVGIGAESYVSWKKMILTK
jgi:photosystem II stability/assembly factor-like uncharacterized protein